MRSIRVKDSHDEGNTVRTLLDIGRQHNLRDCVLFPRRDETEAACARHREELASFFQGHHSALEDSTIGVEQLERLQTGGATGYSLSADVYSGILMSLRISIPRLPIAIKPTIKKKLLFCATGAKAWRAETPEQLHRLFARARREAGSEENPNSKDHPRRREYPVFLSRICSPQKSTRNASSPPRKAAPARIRPRRDLRSQALTCRSSRNS